MILPNLVGKWSVIFCGLVSWSITERFRRKNIKIRSVCCAASKLSTRLFTLVLQPKQSAGDRLHSMGTYWAKYLNFKIFLSHYQASGSLVPMKFYNSHVIFVLNLGTLYWS